MRPYNVEIFDKKLKYLCSTTINPSSFSYAWDALSPVTNTVTVSPDVVPSPPNPNEIQSWYIRISRPGEEYQGLIKSIARGKNADVIRYNPLIYLFDDDVRVKTSGVAETTATDDYIRDVIKENYVNNSDATQNVPYLTVNSLGNVSSAYALEYEYTESLADWKTRMELEHSLTGGQWFDDGDNVYGYYVWEFDHREPGEVDEETGEVITPARDVYDWHARWRGNYAATTTTTLSAGGLAFDYANGSDPYCTISLLNDLILPAATVYFIFCEISIDFENKSILCRIGLNKEKKKAIETALPSVYDSTITIKETTKEINKAVIMDKTTMTSSHDASSTIFYMHSTGKFDNNGNSDRLIPVHTDYESYSSVTSNAEALARSGYQSYLNVFKTYAHVNRQLTDSELQSLEIAVNALIPKAFDANAINVNIINNADWQALDGGGNIQITNKVNNRPRFVVSKNVVGWVDIKFPEKPSSAVNMISHVYLYMEIDEGDGLFSYTVYQDLTDANATAGANYFYSSEDYNTLVRIYEQRATEMYIHQLANKAFTKSKYRNLIEFTVFEDDAILTPTKLKAGQEVEVIHKGKSYNSILTGIKRARGLVTLTFGTIRLELTKILKGGQK